MSTASRHELVQSLKIAPWRWLAWPKARLGSRRNKCDLNSLLLTRVLSSDRGLDETNSNDGTVWKKRGRMRREGNFYPSSLVVSLPVAHWPHLRHHRVCETKHLAATGEIGEGIFPQMEHEGRRWGRSFLPASRTAAPHGVCSALEPLFKGSTLCSWANWTRSQGDHWNHHRDNKHLGWEKLSSSG